MRHPRPLYFTSKRPVLAFTPTSPPALISALEALFYKASTRISGKWRRGELKGADALILSALRDSRRKYSLFTPHLPFPPSAHPGTSEGLEGLGVGVIAVQSREAHHETFLPRLFCWMSRS